MRSKQDCNTYKIFLLKDHKSIQEFLLLNIFWSKLVQAHKIGQELYQSAYRGYLVKGKRSVFHIICRVWAWSSGLTVYWRLLSLFHISSFEYRVPWRLSRLVLHSLVWSRERETECERRAVRHLKVPNGAQRGAGSLIFCWAFNWQID